MRLGRSQATLGVVLSDPELNQILRQSLEDIRHGRMLDYEYVKRELCRQPTEGWKRHRRTAEPRPVESDGQAAFD